MKSYIEMKMNHWTPPMPRPVLMAVFLIGCLSVGCAGPSTSLTVTSLEKGKTYHQRFDKAYAGRSEQGDFEVVLVRDAGGVDGDKKAPLVRQVMHVRMLWKPMKGTKLDHPTATNATIDWYVFGGTGAREGLVAYTGAGFVAVQRSGGVAKLDIRNATLRPTTRAGHMTDPIGPAKLQGTIVARTGRREQVRELLGEVRQASARIHAAKDDAARQASSRAPMDH